MIRRQRLIAAALVALISVAGTVTPNNAVAAGHGAIEVAAVEPNDQALLDAVQGTWNYYDAPKLWIRAGFAQVLTREIARTNGRAVPRATAPNTADAAAISLEGWSPTLDPTDEPNHRYAANTTDWLMQEIVDEVGIEAVRRVITSVIIDRTTAYGVTIPADGGSFASNQLLDLLEYDARSTKARQLFEKYVYFPGPATDQYLAKRPVARARYEALMAAAGEWKIPLPIRGSLSGWTYDAAMELMTEAEAVLRSRDEIAKLSAQFGAKPSPLLRRRFEEAQYQFDDAKRLAFDQLESARAIAAAATRLHRGRGVFERIGLLSASPEVKLEQAKEQFENDSFDVTKARLREFDGELDDARSRGLERIFMVVFPLALLWAVTTWVRRLRRRAREADERRERTELRLSAYGRSPGAGYTSGTGYSPGDEGR